MADADYWVEQLEEAIDELESDVTAAKKRPTGSAQLSAISKIEGKMYDIKRTQRVLKHEINQLTNKAEKNALGKVSVIVIKKYERRCGGCLMFCNLCRYSMCRYSNKMVFVQG